MNYRYEKMCVAAGCNEETTAGIRRYLDAEKKRLKRQRQAKAEEGIVFNRMSTFVNDDGDPMDFPSEENFEDDYYHEVALIELRKALMRLTEDDRIFILRVFSQTYGSEVELEKELNASRKTIRYRKERIISTLRRMLVDQN